MDKSLFTSLIFAVSGFLIFAMVIPQYDAIADVRAMVKEREKLLADRTAAQENVKRLMKEYQARQADIGKFKVLLPETKQLDQIIASIQALAQGNGLGLRTLTAGDVGEAAGAGYKKTSIKVELGGTYPALLGFLKELEKNLRLYDVLELSIGRDPGATNPSALSFEVKISTYNLK